MLYADFSPCSRFFHGAGHVLVDERFLALAVEGNKGPAASGAIYPRLPGPLCVPAAHVTEAKE